MNKQDSRCSKSPCGGFRGLLFIFTICSIVAQAQTEHIEYLPHTPQKSALKSAVRDFAPTQLLALPFFDDFAYPQSKPMAQLWADDFAFVNTSFAKNAPTIGVLTLDALDNNGMLYPQASSNVFTADYATSQPINLLNYRKVFASNMLYKENGELFESNTYYLYVHSLRSFIDVVKGVPYYAGDTIYTKTASGFEPTPTPIKVYDEKKVLIPESETNTQTWIPYKATDNIALSFYYQAGGYADRPEAQDSLILEFYVPFARQGIFINEITQSWVEIFNATDTVVSLGGYYLVADTLKGYYLVADTLENVQAQQLAQWQIPAKPAMTVAPYSHTIITAADLQIEKFTSSRFYLLSPAAHVKDSSALEKPVSAENSYARIPDGNPEWSFSAIETPAQPNDTWKTMWSASSADMGDDFSLITIPIISDYLQKGFRFRFKNYASLSNDPSHARNEDFWHIDMVWIDANRTPDRQNVADVAFVTDILPLYNRYTALPIAHFPQLNEGDFRMTVVSSFRNFDKVPRKIKFNFAVQNSQTNEKVSFPLFETDMDPYYMAPAEYEVLSDWDVEFFDFIKTGIANTDSTNFEFQYFFTDNNNPIFDHYRWNDTSRVNLTMSNYYAYDDGIPEAGYGLRNAPMGQVAYKFDILKPDTLRAIHLYFNPTLEQMPKLFNLCVWSVNDKGLPGDLLYRKISARVLYADGLYKFVTYPIEPNAILTGEPNGIFIEKSCFIGWEQPQDVLLNMGMDLTNQMSNRLYFNTAYRWEPSTMKGALMIRPQFGEKRATSISGTAKKTNSVLLYPTIIQSQAYIQANEEIVRCEFVDITGKPLQQLPVHNNTIDCNSVPNGFYVLKLYGAAGVVAVKKCVVRR